MPMMPPRSDDMNTLMNDALISGYFACSMYMAGRVNIAPATTAPEHAPMLCMMTFSPSGLWRFAAVDTPTAMIAMGIAASNTCPTRSPRYAAAAEKTIAMSIPHVTDHAFTSGYCLCGFITGRYSSPSFSSLNAFSGSLTASFSFSVITVFLLFCMFVT